MKELHSILISRTCILFALVCILIPGCYFADNYIDLAYAFTTQKLSVLYFFFGSYTFAGQFGTYLVAMISSVPLAYLLLSLSNRYQKTIYKGIHRFAAFSSLAGFACLCGTLSYFIIASCILPFSTADFANNIATAPYIHYISKGSPFTYILVALSLSFLKGTLWGGIILMGVLWLRSVSGLVILPPLFRFFYRQAERLIGVPLELRMDRWLSMETISHSEAYTILLSCASVLVALFLLWVICKFTIVGKKHEINKNAHISIINKIPFICIGTIILVFLYLLIVPWKSIALGEALKFDLYIYPQVLNDIIVQNVLQFGMIAFSVFMIRRPIQDGLLNPKTIARKNFVCILSISIIYSITILLVLLAFRFPFQSTLEQTDAWLCLIKSIKNNGFAYITPNIDILINFSMYQALFIQFFLQTLVFTFLGLIVLVVDTITENLMGSIMAIICVLMNITSYNLLGIDVYRWIPCALAQLKHYLPDNAQYGLTLEESFFKLVILIILLFIIYVISCKIRLKKRIV